MGNLRLIERVRVLRSLVDLLETVLEQESGEGLDDIYVSALTQIQKLVIDITKESIPVEHIEEEPEGEPEE